MPVNTVSDVIGNNGAPIEWTDSQGKKYQLSLITLKVQSKIERMIEHDAIEALKAHKDLIEADSYAFQLSKILRDITQGKYTFGGDYCQEALNTVKGFSSMVSAIMGIDREEALRLMVSEPELKDVIGVVAERSYPKKVERPAVV